MSHAEYVSRPIPVFTKLAGVLRNIPAMQFVFAKFAGLFRGGDEASVKLVGEFPDDAPGISEIAIDHHVAIPESTIDVAVAPPELDDASEREKLVRRRWAETGIKMWNASGGSVLNIQGRSDLLPAKPGETQSRYDTLQFRLIGHDIVCEGVVVDRR